MKLISCSECGIVVDQDKITWPEEYNGDIDAFDFVVIYVDGESTRKIDCPVCKIGNILEES